MTQEPKKLTLATDDCIVSVKNTQEVFMVVTKLHEISVYRDELKRPALIVQDGHSYIPKYDVNLPGKMTAIVSNDTGVETKVSVVQNGQTAKTFKELLATAPKLRDVMCKGHVHNPVHDALDAGPTEKSILEESEGEDWAAIGFESEYASEAFWANEFYPEFDAAVNFANRRDEQKACAQKWGNCNGACDNVADAKNGSCAIGALLLIDFPVASALFAIACGGGVLWDKNRCKASCGSIASCF